MNETVIVYCYKQLTCSGFVSHFQRLVQHPVLTVSVVVMEETMCSLDVESDDCLLSTESLKEDSLTDTDMQSFLRAWARKCKQGTFSARVILLKQKHDLLAKCAITFQN